MRLASVGGASAKSSVLMVLKQDRGEVKAKKQRGPEEGVVVSKQWSARQARDGGGQEQSCTHQSPIRR
jgi:hypothetical protein